MQDTDNLNVRSQQITGAIIKRIWTQSGSEHPALKSMAGK